MIFIYATYEWYSNITKIPQKTKRKIFQVLNNLNQIFAETIRDYYWFTSLIFAFNVHTACRQTETELLTIDNVYLIRAVIRGMNRVQSISGPSLMTCYRHANLSVVGYWRFKLCTFLGMLQIPGLIYSKHPDNYLLPCYYESTKSGINHEQMH